MDGGIWEGRIGGGLRRVGWRRLQEFDEEMERKVILLGERIIIGIKRDLSQDQ